MEKKKDGISSTQFNHKITSGDEKRFNESAEYVSDGQGGHERICKKRDKKKRQRCRWWSNQNEHNCPRKMKKPKHPALCWIMLSCRLLLQAHAVFFFSLTSQIASAACPPPSGLVTVVVDVCSQGREVGLRVGRFSAGGSL